ncbi:hypothetical protein ACFU8X_26530 [Brevibacillus porteri]|uniref:hypothetical protein n=1 Tax=Brevibacillus porteri TaxID=2126350 RepID=UPI00370CB48B
MMARMYSRERKRSLALFLFWHSDNGDFKGEAKIIVDGQEIYQLNEQSSQGAEDLRELLFNEVNEIAIIVSGNTKLWDVGIREMKHWWNEEQHATRL